jgi:hypothetical protein
VSLDQKLVTADEIECIWNFILKNRVDELREHPFNKKSFFIELCKEAAKEFSISNIDRLEKIGKSLVDVANIDAVYITKSQEKIDMEFALKVNKLLPHQPWKPGIHNIVTKELSCSNNEYFLAVKMLIDEGLRNRQKDGIVCDSEGNVICFDKDRVNPESLELLPPCP